MHIAKSPYNQLYTNRSKFIILVTGGRGSAKSYEVSFFAQRLTFEAGHIILFSRYTMVSAGISIIPEILQKIEIDGTVDKFNITGANIENKVSGSKILFRGIKTSSGNQTANLKSIQGLSCFIGDEMEEWQSESDFDTLKLSIRQKGIQNRVILVMNPTDDEHFIYKKYIQDTHRIEVIDGVEVQISTHPDVLHIHTTYLNNAENLGINFLNDVEAIKQKSIEKSTVNGVFDSKLFQKTKYAYTVIGRWNDVAEGVIFDNVEEGLFDDSLPYIYGADFGHSIDPTTLIKIAVDRRKKRVYVHEEYYKSSKIGLRSIYEIFKSRVKFPNDLIVGDSAEDRLIFDLKELGLNIEECEKGPGSVVAGITDLMDYTIVVTAESTNLKKEFKNYKWSDKKAGVPIDANNHGIDPIRYGFRKLSPNPGITASDLSIFA